MHDHFSVCDCPMVAYIAFECDALYAAAVAGDKNETLSSGEAAAVIRSPCDVYVTVRWMTRHRSGCACGLVADVSVWRVADLPCLSWSLPRSCDRF